MKKLGFTLAEVLITLGIIGVVAALTTPALVKSSRNEQNAAKLAVTVNALENAFTSAIATEGVNDLWQTRMWASVGDYVKGADGHSGLGADSTKENIAAFMGELGKYLITNGYRKESVAQYYAKSHATTYTMNANGSRGAEIDLSEQGAGKMFPIIMKNGAVLFFRGIGPANFRLNEETIRANGGSMFGNPGDVFIDVNGASEPNTIGRDIFAFCIGQNGILYPEGSRDLAIFDSVQSNSINLDNLPTWDNADKKNGRSCVDGQIAVGWGCTARLIEENYKMNY